LKDHFSGNENGARIGISFQDGGARAGQINGAAGMRIADALCKRARNKRDDNECRSKAGAGSGE
jgi:hypothetical protein